MRAAEGRSLDLPEVDAFDSIKGKGVRASVAGAELLVGNVKLMCDARIALPAALAARHETLERDGKTSMLVAKDGALVGVIAVRDEPREAAKATIAALKAQGVKHTVMLTGDNGRALRLLGYKDRAVAV